MTKMAVMMPPRMLNVRATDLRRRCVFCCGLNVLMSVDLESVNQYTKANAPIIISKHRLSMITVSVLNPREVQYNAAKMAKVRLKEAINAFH